MVRPYDGSCRAGEYVCMHCYRAFKDAGEYYDKEKHGLPDCHPSPHS